MNEHVAVDVSKVAAPATPERSRASPPGKSKGRRNTYRLTAGVLILLLIAAAGVAWWLSSVETSVRYTTVPVTRGAVTRTVTATGTVNPVLTIIVGTYVSGVIQQLFCDYNTQVKRGQVCAKIDPRPYQSLVDQAKANLAVAKAQLEKDKAYLVYAKLNSERNARLVQTNAISQDVYDLAKSTYEQALAQITFDEATIQQRQASLDAAQVNLDYTDIASPVDGVVVSRAVTMGQTVAASFQTPTLFLIATDLTKMEVDTNVSESDIGALAVDNKASFAVDAYPRRVFAGSVSQVRQSPQTVQNVVTYDVVVGVDNSDLALKPGMTAAIRIVIAERGDVIRVPNQALRYSPGGIARTALPPAAGAPSGARAPGTGERGEAQIWLMRDGQSVVVSVVPGLEDDSFTEILDGDVKPGDQVIVAEQRGTGGGSSGLPRPRL